MKIIPATPKAVEEALALLARGGVIVHATETCYGITCDLADPQAVARLFAIKRRPETQPVSALFASRERTERYVEWPSAAVGLAKRYLPGPLTIVLPVRADAPALHPTPNGKAVTLGVRISSHPLATELAARHPTPLSTTSANISGMPEAYDVPSLLKQFGGITPDLVIDEGLLRKTPPSTVVAVEDEKLRILRQGGLRIEQ